MSKTPKQIQKEKQAKARAKTREIKKKLSFVKKIGAYEPKGDELTPYRIKQINKAYAEYSEFSLDKYKYVKVKKGQEAAISAAQKLDIKTTKNRIIVKKVGKRRATLGYDKTLKEYRIQLRGEIQRGQNRGEKISTNIPLSNIDEIENLKDYLRDQAKALGPLKKGERLAFVISDHHDSFSKNLYKTPEQVINKLTQYRKDDKGKTDYAMQIELFRHVSIIKVENSEKYREDHPTAAQRKRWAKSEAGKYKKARRK